jgi:hypothetical protein
MATQALCTGSLVEWLVEEVLVVIEPAVKEQILKDLDRLSPELQQRARELVHSLVDTLPKGASVKDMIALGGLFDEESAREIREAIEEHCERIDPNEW